MGYFSQLQHFVHDHGPYWKRRDTGFAFLFLNLFKNCVFQDQYDDHGSEYDELMGDRTSDGEKDYQIKKVARCKRRVATLPQDHQRIVKPMELTTEQHTKAAEALEAADVYDMNCHLCWPEKEVVIKDTACMIFALNKCVPGVLSTEDLNEQIPNVHEEKAKMPECSFTEENCGVPNETWNMDCVYKALKKKYGHGGFKWEKQKGDDILWKKNKGLFYVTGELNRALFPDLEEQEGSWAHAVCVDTNKNKFYDTSNDENGQPFKSWFEAGPNCYMKIWRVYKLEICPQPPQQQQPQKKQKVVESENDEDDVNILN